MDSEMTDRKIKLTNGTLSFNGPFFFDLILFFINLGFYLKFLKRIYVFFTFFNFYIF